MVYADMVKMCKEYNMPHRNLNRRELFALKTLENNHDITIKPADKCGTILVLKKEEHMKETYRLLLDCDCYRTLNKDPSDTFGQDLQNLINKASTLSVINKKEGAFLLRNFYQIQYYYFLPKIHKDPIPPLGGLVVASMGSIINGPSQYVDFFLSL